MKSYNYRILLILLICIHLFESCASANARKKGLDDELTLREKIAQMLMVGFDGTGPMLNSEMDSLVKVLKVGGVIIFEKWGNQVKNISSREQLTQLVANLHNAALNPFFVAIDQEGGNVSRLKSEYGYPESVTAQSVGERNNDEYTHETAKTQAEMLKSTGIDINFAPCLDVNVNPMAPAIGARGRSFSEDTAIVAHIAAIYYEEQKNAGVISVFKHFPGHGSAMKDTHLGFTDISTTWQPYELAPYKELIQSKECDMVMTAHVFNAQLDSVYPATLSKNVITGILRNQLKFDGIVISDDLAMGALKNHWSLDEILKSSINAGVDMLCISRGGTAYYLEIINRIEEMVNKGEIPEQRINEAYNRIIALHRKMIQK